MKQLMFVLVLLAALQGVSGQSEIGSSAGTQKSTVAAKTIDIEPEQCVTRCYYLYGVPIYCYTMCF